MNPRELARDRNQAFAEEFVANLSPDLVKDLCPSARLESIIHSSNDAFGNRITPEERSILRKTKDNLRRKLADKYTGGNLDKFGGFEYANHLDFSEVRSELVKKMGQ